MSAGEHIPQVSIGLPVRNGERFLERSIESLLAQSLADLELVISDNCSDDRTPAIIEHYAERDGRIRYFRQPFDIGAVRNFEFVRRQARAPYFMWAAADDEFDPRWLETLLASSDASTVLAFGHVVNVDETGRVTRTYPPLGFSRCRALRIAQFFLRPESGGKANLIYGLYPAMAVAGCALEDLPPDEPADQYFLFRLVQLGQVVTNPSVLLRKRWIPPRRGEEPKAGILERLWRVLGLSSFRSTRHYIRLARGVHLKILLCLLAPVRHARIAASTCAAAARSRLEAVCRFEHSPRSEIP